MLRYMTSLFQKCGVKYARSYLGSVNSGLSTHVGFAKPVANSNIRQQHGMSITIKRIIAATLTKNNSKNNSLLGVFAWVRHSQQETLWGTTMYNQRRLLHAGSSTTNNDTTGLGAKKKIPLRNTVVINRNQPNRTTTRRNVKKDNSVIKNMEIRERTVRVFDEEGKSLGILPTREALNIAQRKGLDLVTIDRRSEPVVCKIFNYHKQIFEEKKRKQESSGDKSGKLKEVTMGVNIQVRTMTLELLKVQVKMARA